MFRTVRARGVIRGAAALLMALGLVLAPTVDAASTPPDRMSYQGFLVDGNGDPLAPSAPENYQVVFRIYDEQDGGEPLWTEQQTVTVDRGNFSVVLGEGSDAGAARGPLSQVFAGTTASQRYMGLTVTIGGNSLTLLPRLRLLPAPYSFLASQAAQLVDPSTGLPFVSLSGTQTTIPGNTSFGGSLFWGSGAGLTGSNGGSIELGDSTSTGVSPYIDFHYGTGAAQDWNMRLINDGDGRMSLLGGRLSFDSTLANTKLAIWEHSSTADTAYGLGVQASQFRFHVGNSSARFSFLNAPAGTEVMSIHGDGRVGIGTGTAAPRARLEVMGWVNANRTFTWYARGKRTTFFGQDVGNIGNTSGTVDYSILAERRIGASEFNAFSDARIKDVVGVSDSKKDLEIIQQLRVKDYYFVDKVGEGEGLKKGFIAQEVRSIIPEAISTSRRFIPDIYALPESFEYDPSSERLSVTMKKAHGLKEGERVQIISDEARLELSVAKVISPEQFVLENCEQKPGQIFVFGREVPDFHILNYDHIFTTGISAIQELHRQVEEKEARIASLEHEVAGLRKQMTASADSNTEWQARFVALEKIVAQFAREREVMPTTVAIRQSPVVGPAR